MRKLEIRIKDSHEILCFLNLGYVLIQNGRKDVEI